MSNIGKCIETLYRGEYLQKSELIQVLKRAEEILRDLPNIVQVRSPVVIVGDIHGQFFDLLEMFDTVGKAPDTNFLFLGDYVDRGNMSVEVFSLLICLKIRYPNRITLLRGNHESRQVSQVYGFHSECMNKYDSEGSNSRENPHILHSSKIFDIPSSEQL